MIWNDRTSGNLLVSYNFANGIWTMQPNVLRVRVAGVSDSVRVRLTLQDDEVEYATDNTGRVTIDLSDIMRGKSIGSSVSISVSYLSNSISISASVLGLIDPLEMIIPQSLQSDQMQEAMLIAPPTTWIEPLFGLSDSVELYLKASAQSSATLRLDQNSVQLVNGCNDIDVSSGVSAISLIVGSASKKYRRAELLCGRRYAAVEWTSRSGMKKRHTWEVVQVSDSTNNSTEYQSILGYDVRKGQEQSITLRLQGLTRYDYWYYSDIITSNNVRVAISEHDADFGDETRVKVVTKKVVQPDANGQYTLSVELKYKRYDEF